MKTTLIICILLATCLNANSQLNSMTEQEAFYYFMKVYQHHSYDRTVCQFLQSNYVDFYCQVFDNYQYKMNVNDEFNKKSYFDSKANEIEQAITNLQFTKKYAYYTQGTIGEYNNDGFTIKDVNQWRFKLLERNHSIPPTGQGGQMEIKIEWNLNPLDGFFKMERTAASNFIQSRKNTLTGQIDRTVYLKKVYSIVNVKNSNIPGFGYCDEFGPMWLTANVDSIEVFQDAGYQKKICAIFPVVKENANSTYDKTENSIPAKILPSYSKKIFFNWTDSNNSIILQTSYDFVNDDNNLLENLLIELIEKKLSLQQTDSTNLFSTNIYTLKVKNPVTSTKEGIIKKPNGTKMTLYRFFASFSFDLFSKDKLIRSKSFLFDFGDTADSKELALKRSLGGGSEISNWIKSAINDQK